MFLVNRAASVLGKRPLKDMLPQKIRPHLQCRCYTQAPLTLSSQSHLIRPIGKPHIEEFEADFALYPNLYSLDETRELLRGALWKLDRVDPVRKRRRRGTEGTSGSVISSGPLQDLFTGVYGFEEGHYDSVIRDYRETTISSLPPLTTFPTLPTILNRAFSLFPGSPRIQNDVLPPTTISHLLHLASSGRIDGHVDNLEASGKIIMGICLGSDRILRLTKKSTEEAGGVVGWDVLLKNGSVYIQQDKLRYEFEHSILSYEDSEWDGEKLGPGHRLSIMVRDAPSRPARL